MKNKIKSKNLSPKKLESYIIIALGGSIIAPNFPRQRAGKINITFLKKFRKLILKYLKLKMKFIIIAGGGAVARNYQDATSKIAKISNEDKDWIGIHSTRLNAHLLRTIFYKEAYPVVLDDPHKPLSRKIKKDLIIASGWRPGWSTDYIAVLLAHRFKTKKVIIAGRPSFVYTKDHARFKKAKPIKEIHWKNYQKLIKSRWIPGMKAPVDPVATKLARKLEIKAIIIKGTNIKNLEKVIVGEKFRGTIIY